MLPIPLCFWPLCYPRSRFNSTSVSLPTSSASPIPDLSLVSVTLFTPLDLDLDLQELSCLYFLRRATPPYPLAKSDLPHSLSVSPELDE